VTTTVHSGTEPTSVVVTATATTSDGVDVSGQSDTLVVSNGVVSMAASKSSPRTTTSTAA
jgi:hypothetical protein